MKSLLKKSLSVIIKSNSVEILAIRHFACIQEARLRRATESEAPKNHNLLKNSWSSLVPKEQIIAS